MGGQIRHKRNVQGETPGAESIFDALITSTQRKHIGSEEQPCLEHGPMDNLISEQGNSQNEPPVSEIVSQTERNVEKLYTNFYNTASQILKFPAQKRLLQAGRGCLALSSQW